MKVNCPAPGCGKTLSLRKDGTIWNHSGPSGAVCAGAGLLWSSAPLPFGEGTCTCGGSGELGDPHEPGCPKRLVGFALPLWEGACTCGGPPHVEGCPNDTEPELDAPAGKEPLDIPPTGICSLPHPSHGRQNGEEAPWFRAAYSGGCAACDSRIDPGDLIKSDGAGGYLCEKCGAKEPEGPHPRSRPSEQGASFCDRPGCGKHAPQDQPYCSGRCYDLDNDTKNTATTDEPDLFAGLFPPEPEPKISGQPEPKRDGYGRYLLKVDDAFKTDWRGKPEGYTRATTFAKTLSDTFALSQWGKRSVAVGLAMRPDLLAQVHGKDVRADKRELDKLHEKASEAAGDKIYAALGTNLHTFTEKLDAGLITLDEVPPQFRAHLSAYVETMAASGLTTRPQWIERTTMVSKDTFGEAVAGTADRLYRMPDGSLVIGDLKTGRDLSYGWGEIAIQLLTYALGANEYGFYDWSRDLWERLPEKVRTDYAIVMHMPVQLEPGMEPYCKLYKVKFKPEVLEAAKMCAAARTWRKTKDIAEPYVPLRYEPEEQPAPAPEEEVWFPRARPPLSEAAKRVIQESFFRASDTVTSKDQARVLYNAAKAQAVPPEALGKLVDRCNKALAGEPSQAPSGPPEVPHEPTWAERFAVATSRGAMATLFMGAKAAGVDAAELKALVDQGMKRLEELEDPAG